MNRTNYRMIMRKVASLEHQLEDARNEMVEEQEIFYASTNESKNLITELKSELDAARGEIAEMKRSGMSDSVETKQAVSQLQEALGTIRILKESLDEAEQASLEVDNLKAELADSMALQLQKMKDSDEEKAKLKEEMENLETEIAVLRNTKAGEGVAGMQKATQLAENLKLGLVNLWRDAYWMPNVSALVHFLIWRMKCPVSRLKTASSRRNLPLLAQMMPRPLPNWKRNWQMQPVDLTRWKAEKR